MSRAFVSGVVIAVVVLVGLWWSRAEPAVAIDLVAELHSATQRRPSPEAFTVQEVTIAGTSTRAIAVAEPSRLAWEQTVPSGGWLRVSLGVREQAWQRAGSGVLFMVGVSHGGRYEELVNIVIDPFAHATDRQWLPVLLDLAPWAGQRVELVFNTRIAETGATGGVHLPVWGAPAMVTR